MNSILQTQYSHLIYEQRIKLEFLNRRKIPISEIAKELNIHRSTIYREFSRNNHKVHHNTYSADTALAIRKKEDAHIPP